MVMSRTVFGWRGASKVAAAALLSAFLSACSALPGSGPLRETVVEGAQAPDSGYNVVSLDSRVIEHLERRHVDTLYGTFRDGRPSPDLRIGIGDSVQVTIWEAAAGGLFSAPAAAVGGAGIQAGSRAATIPEQVVARDGSITVPYAGRIRVVGNRPPDVERIIVNRLTGKAIEPQALVTVTRNMSTTATVVGEGGQGGVVPLSVRGTRLLEALALTGGVRAQVHETFVNLARDGRAVRVPLQSVMRRPQENIFLRPNDVLTLVRDPQTFTAVGATGRNAVIPFEAVGISLEEAIAKSGGLIDTRADPDGVFVLRYEPLHFMRSWRDPREVRGHGVFVPVIYQLNMRDPAALFMARRFQIRDKDIVYVSNAPFAEIQKLFSLITTVAQPAIQGASIGAGFR
jgi:polysaccharide export outer membrane protein